MKKIILQSILLFSAFILMFGIMSCEEETEPVDFFPDDDVAPTLTITSPDIPAEGLLPEIGTTLVFNLSVEDNNGLSGIFVGETNIRNYFGTEKEGTVTYEVNIVNLEERTLVFSVEDAAGNKTSTEPIEIKPVTGIDLGFLLIDFAGTAAGDAEEKTVVDWDVRTKRTFNISGEIGSTATTEIVAKQGQVSFAQPNPDPNETAKVLKYVKTPVDAGNNWGGWDNLIFGLEGTIPEAEINALPAYDPDSNEKVAGTKIIAVDVYYDDTADDDFDWATLTSLSGVWNSDPSQGYKLDLIIGGYDAHASTEGGYDGTGYYMCWSEYIPEPNKWVTVEFDDFDAGRIGNSYHSGSDASVGPDEVNCFNFKVSSGYDEAAGVVDDNPLYFKNLRIIEVE